MGMGASLSIIGMYNYDNTLFDLMAVPAEFDSDTRELLINNILLECGGLETVYPEITFLKQAIGIWSEKELPTWERIYNAMMAEYDPIENYNRNESITVTEDGEDKHSGNDVSANSGTDSFSNTPATTTTEKVTGYDSGSLVDRSQIVEGGTSSGSQTYGSTNTFTHGEKIKRDNKIITSGNIHGNIGVTTSQQMLEQEIEIAPKLNVMDYICISFRERFCLLVY